MTDNPTPTIPSRETIEYGRRVLLSNVALLDRWLAEDPTHEGWKRVKWWIESRLLGGEGCVITPFDSRWLMDDFRAAMEEVRRG